MKGLWYDAKPFLSVLIILSFMFLLVFIKMDNRQMGYQLFKLYQKEKKAREEQRHDMAVLARMTSPERIRRLAISRYSYQPAEEGQVIRIAGSGSAVIK